ncbi:TIGR04063 family PEP-CTERM/XrtA system glycosyltransferase [Parahaliea mediterranea]|uniref:TIGR04063 family PEP-CTERM/XrtA system glycosyltransferase n=1 Tax=Parahaliea mediterranea TaxID=651086 RepID=UPI0019D43BB6|nr:TIGR04063 family PEP-CTERM/XrtA system glycosyltransferase [Parahaliea mediterranea]
MAPLHILHVLDHSIPMHSGYTFRTRSILRAQRERGWHTSHVTGLKHTQAGPAEEEVDGLRFYRTPATGAVLERLPLASQWQVVRTLARRIDEVVERERPDVLHAHSPALNGLAALQVGRRRGLPVVYECRAFWEDAAVDHGTSVEGGARYRLTRALESRVFRKADAVTTICEGLKSDIVGRGIDAAKVTVIPNAVDVQAFALDRPRDEALAAQLGLSGRRVTGFIGSFYAYEGIPLLLDAMAALRERHPDLALLLVGGGPQEGLIKQRIGELGLDAQVVFTGRVPHEEVQRYYSLVDIFAYPRQSMRLTDLVTPLKPLEAMAEGKLVVASDVGGHRELIRNDDNGVLFKAGSAEALADALDRLYSAPESWPGLRAAGREYVETERNWAASVARYQTVYGGLT